MTLRVNGCTVSSESYARFHAPRFDATMALIRGFGGGRVVELGGHPWAMTSRLLAEAGVTLEAAVSAEEVIPWSDEMPVTSRQYEIELENSRRLHFRNISANIERTLFSIDAEVDIVLACEIIEHLTRAPHMMMLNINRWLKPGGLVILTTPNGAQLQNPFRVRPKMPAYRPSVYSRHNYVFTMDGLRDLIECCGFEIVQAQYWSPYRRRGPSDFYRRIYNAGPKYLKDKFAQTLCVVARKIESRDSASRLPRVYSPEAGWERVENPDAGYSERVGDRNAGCVPQARDQVEQADCESSRL